MLAKREIEQARDLEINKLRRRVLEDYHDFLDVFSKKELDTLPLFRLGVDYKIELEGELPRGYYPLYKMSAEELLIAR